MTILAVVTMTPKPGRIDDVIGIFADIAPQVHAEEGCLLAAVHKTPDGQVVVIEKYADEAAVAAHRANPVMAGANERLLPLLAAPVSPQLLEQIPLGDPGKCTI